MNDSHIPGSNLLERVTSGPTLFWSHFLNFLSAQGLILTFLSILGQNFSFVLSKAIKKRYHVCSRVSKIRFCVNSR